ncbi:unnamed protein product [Heterobilharzia americana]|nr:unnamed protein product [Heterobilharzia americana]
MDVPTSTLMLRGLTSSTTERDVRRTLDNERAKYTDVRLVRDKKSGRWIGFVDFVSVNDAKMFMRDCQGEIEVRKTIIRLTYSNSKDRRDEEYDDASPTIMLRGIPSSLDHRDIRDALDDARVSYLDVRVIKDKATGISKGFGFVDFASVHEARRWMDYQKGIFRVRRYEIRLMYSTPRNQLDSLIHHSGDAPGLLGPSSFMVRSPALSEVSTGDWICSRCSSHNFRRRDQCYKCQLPRSQVQSLTNSVDGVDLIGTTPCNTLVLRCLDALTTEEDICQVFQDIADVKVRQCHVMRDEVTHASRCFAFAELPTVADAYKVMDIVNKEFKLFEVGGKAVTVSYAKNTFNTIMATLKTEGSYNAQLNSSRNLALDLAHAAMAAQNNNISPDTVAMNAVAASALLSQTSNNGAAVAQAAIQQKQTEQHVLSALTKSLRNHAEHTVSSSYVPSMAALAASGQQLPPPSFPFNAATATSTTYPFPDTSKYIYDESTRFYYDPVTGLMYEPNSKYFYDRASQQYYYWDQTKSTYLPVPQSNSQSNTVDTAASDSQTDVLDTSKNKDDRGKTAQQIAREMEKWAKKMNAQKKTSSSTTQRTDVTVSEASKTADTGYAILEASTNSALGSDSRTPESASLVAEYGGVEDSDDSGQDESHGDRQDSLLSLNSEAEAKVAEEESKLLDWAKLACMLCSRGFKDAATLQKHRAFSALHYENLNKLRAKYGLPSIPAPTPAQNPEASSNPNQPKNSLSIASLMQIGAQAASNHAKSVASRQVSGRPSASGQYRDRAKERREKYGIPSPPRMKSVEDQVSTAQLDQDSFVPPLPPMPPPPQSAQTWAVVSWKRWVGRLDRVSVEAIKAELR